MATLHGPAGDVFMVAVGIGTAAMHWMNARGRVIRFSQVLDDVGVDWRQHPEPWAQAHRRTLPFMLIGTLLGLIAFGIALANGNDSTLELIGAVLIIAALLGSSFATRRLLQQSAQELVRAGETTQEAIEENREAAQQKTKDAQTGKLWVAILLLVGLGIYVLVTGKL